MRVETQDYNGVTVIDLHGEFTRDHVEGFIDTVSSIDLSGKVGVVLDLCNIGFIDSKGLETILWLKDCCLQASSRLKLAALDSNCRKILEVTRISDQFETYEELSEAVMSFA